jgi:hypothetical protein
MLIIVRQRVARKIYAPAGKVKVTHKGQSSGKDMMICIRVINYHLFRNCNTNCHEHYYGCVTCNLGQHMQC